MILISNNYVKEIEYNTYSSVFQLLQVKNSKNPSPFN